MVLNKDIAPTHMDKLLTVRLIEAYKKASTDEIEVLKVSKDDLWDRLKQGTHAYFVELLREENIDALAVHLCNMARSGITEGLVQGENEYRKIISDRQYRQYLSISHADMLVSLAEAIGVMPCENPAQGTFGINIFSDLDQIIEKIEQCMKINIIPPDIEGGLLKLNTKKGSMNCRDISAVYTAWRIKEILRGQSMPAICEIGAGIGKVAYYAKLLGINYYTIIDLPHVNVLQGFYLIKSLPSANIVLYGEGATEKEDAIHVLPYWSFDRKAAESFDLTLNQDSFPEINGEIVLNYLKQMKRNTKKYFLSINQESQGVVWFSNFKQKQNVVAELVGEIQGFERISRAPFWLRKGYVEEVFEINRA
jgi:hypothetical protein